MALFRLTDEQENAVNNLEGNLQIIACAGSGKTEVVSRRIAYLVKSGTASDSIVAFTFTEKAAEELKSRIREILEKVCPERADIGDMYVGTIHSFCFEMLRELDPRYRNFDVLNDNIRFAFISMPRRWYCSHLPSLVRRGKYSTISKFLDSVDILRMEDLDPEVLLNHDFVEAYYRYENFLEDDRYLDFSSMIYRLVKTLDSDPQFKHALNQRIKHLVVDEYQDVNRLQERLIRHISDGCESLCVVGDDDQCIYHWRGSTVENIINFKHNYGDVTQIPISQNFRSTKKIIDCAENFIEHNRKRLKKSMLPRDKPVNSPQEDDLFFRHFENDDQEIRFIVRRIKDLLGTDCFDKRGLPFSISYGDVAILTRKRWHASKIVPYLEEAGIPFVLNIGEEVFERPELVLSLKCLAYLFDVNYDDTRYSLEDLVEDYLDIFENRKVDEVTIYPLANLSIFLERIKQLKNDVNKVISKGRRDYLDRGLQLYFHGLLWAFGADRFEFEQMYNYNFAVLSQAIADYESVWVRLRACEVKYFFGFIEAYGRFNYADQSHNDPSLIDAVKVLTIHRAKGLEFPVVFLPEFVDDGKPRWNGNFIDDHLYDVDKYIGTVEDERRVYYTALTRAMKYLFLSSSGRRRKRDGEYYKRPAFFKPHPFIEEITTKIKFSDRIDIDRPKSGYPIRRTSSHFFPTSFSDINIFLRCGHDYRLRNVYGYQAGVPPAFGYGTQIHNILNIIYDEYISSRKIPNDQEIEALFEKYFNLRYATEALTENMRKGGMAVVKRYVEVNKEDFRKVLETEKKFELVHEDALISGKIDLLKKMDEQGNVEEVEVVDFKTENEESELYKRDYELQLRLYAIACMKSLGLSPRKATIHHLDVKSGRGKKEEIDISSNSLDEASNTINNAIDRIIEKDFIPNPTELCQNCDWAQICPYGWRDRSLGMKPEYSVSARIRENT